MLKKPTYLRWLMALTLGVFLWSGNMLNAQEGGRDIGASFVDNITAYYEPGATNVVLEFETNFITPDGAWLYYAELVFPAGVTVTGGTDMVDGTYELPYNGETGDGIAVTWGGIGFPVYLINGNVAPFTVTVDIDPAFTGDLDIDWYLDGDGWGSPPHDVSGMITIEELLVEPGLELLTTNLDLGERPIGAWMKPGVFELINNPGKGDVTITAFEIDDNTGFLELMSPGVPYVLGEGETVEVELSTTAEATDGDMFAGDFAVVYNDGARALITGTYAATAYTPDAGDVAEVAFDGNATAFPNVVAEGNFRNNYDLPGMDADGWDNVYEFTFANDVNVDVSLTATDAKMAFYAAGFGGMGGPDTDNALVSATTTATGLEVLAGTYYLVVSTTGANYTLDVVATAMPAPDAVTYIAPADGAVDIINGDELEWSWGANTSEYQVVLGTTYPPATVVQDWAAAELDENGSFTLSNLNPNLQYFWQVNVRNTEGTTAGAIWGFTTTITPPADLAAEVIDGGESQPTVAVSLEWTSPLDGRAFLGYNVYRDNVQINGSLVTGESYTDLGVARASDFDYNVTAVFDEGESDFSNTASVTTLGVGTINGTVTDLISGDPIEGARVLIDGNLGTYDLLTAANGTYTTLAYAGNYGIDVTADGYIGQTGATTVAHAGTATEDFALMEEAFPVDFVIATEMNDDQVMIEWGFDLASFVPEQYPFDVTGMSEAQIAKNWQSFLMDNSIESKGSNGDARALVEFQVWRNKIYQPGAFELIGTTDQFAFVDFDWGLQDWGVYEWYVVAVYDLNESDPVASNPLDKDMETEVSVTVTTNSGDSPGGTMVAFTNISELDEEGEPQYIFSTVLGSSGMFSWNEFRRGTYEWEVSLTGFETQSGTIDIFDVTDLEFLLIEILAVPADLYVTPTGLATWSAGVSGGATFVPVMETFDAGVPADWTIELGANSTVADNWYWEELYVPSFGDPGSIDGTPFMMIDSDEAGLGGLHVHGLLYSPVMDASDAGALFLEFDQYYRHLGSQYGRVEVYDGSDWVTVLNQTATSGSWITPNSQMIDLTDYINSELQVRFHFYDAGGWNWYWAIDNVSINNVPTREAGAKSFRDLVNYKVFLGGVLVAETEEEFHQYAVANLVDGETYFTEVAAVYSTGQSDFADYTWTYIACDNYATPGDFAAAQVIGTLDVAMSWTIPTIDPLEDQIAFARIYRDGEVLVEVTADNYLDEDLAFGEYTYCITFVYESGAETCVGVICESAEVTGGAFVDGTVVQAAYLGGAPIEGAAIMVYNDDAMFTFFTDADGMYEGEVIAGTYNYEVIASGYITETLAGVIILEAATVTQDFVMMEFPFPVWDVIATELSDASVEVRWRTPSFSSFEPYMESFDAGIPADWTVVDGGTSAATWQGVATYNGSTLDGTPFAFVNSDAAGSGGVIVDEMLYSPAFNTLGVETLFLEFEQYYYHLGAGSFGKVEVYDGTGWVTLLNQTATAGSWTASNFQSIDVSAYVNAEFQVRFHYFDNAAWAWYWAVDNVILTNDVTRGLAREIVEPTLEGYAVYRTSCADGGDLQFLGFTLDTVFNDNTWGTAAAGVYKWGVEAVYAENESEVEFSNCLDKDMVTTVTVTVATNSGDSPEGTDVLFVNTSEPDLGLTYAIELDETGFYSWEDFRKGTYDVFVELLGFAPIELNDVVIDGPANFSWILEELLLPVSNLHVTPTGYATWSEGGVIPFEPVMFDFADGLGEWEAMPATGNWQTSNTSLAGGTAPEIRFYWLPNTLNRFYLMSPMMSTLTQSELELSFKHFVSHFGGPYTLQVVTIADGVEYLVDEWVNPTANIPANTYTTILTDDHGVGADEFQIAFVFDGQAWNINNWNIDDIMLYTPGDRALEYFKVWLDEIFVADTEDMFYQYATDNLVEGQEYLAEVAAVYSNGMSAKMEYTWTYFGCENFPGPDALEAEVVNNENVVLNWSGTTPPPPPGGDMYELSYHNGTAADAYFQSYNFGYGVVYDLSDYNNVTVELLDYRHSPWGVFGTWDYKIHIVDWDTYTLIETTDVMQTTLDNGWELEVPLGSIPESGLVGIFLEPMSNSAADAYPCLDGDQGATTSSFFGALPNWSGMASAGVVGNFLMDLWIMAEPAAGGARGLVKAPVVVTNGTAIAQARGPREIDSQLAEIGQAMMARGQATGASLNLRNDELLWGANWETPQVSTDGIISTYYGGLSAATVSVDDFIIPEGDAWDIHSIWARGFLSAGVPAPQGFGYTIYDNNGGEPGDVLFEEIITGTFDVGQVEIELNDPITLEAGTYWIGIYAYYANASALTGGRWNQYMWNPSTQPGNGAMLADFANLFGMAANGWMTLSSLGINFSSLDFALFGEMSTGGGGGGGGTWEYMGANVYRDGLLIAELVQGETYTDEGVLPGDYTYCVTFVYDDGAESCFGDPCVDVEVTCESPVDLTGEYVWNYNNGEPEFGALIGWSSATAPVAEWLFYDDGINVDGIGGPAAFTWAIKFDPAQLADFDGASLTKIQIYNRLASTDELRIYEGTNAATLLHTQQLTGLAIEAWAEVELTSSVMLDVSKQLWIAVYTTDGANFPAGCGAGQSQPNGDLITLDGVLWEHLTDYGLIYTWNLRGFVTTAAGATAALPMEKPIDRLGLVERLPLKASGVTSAANSVLDINTGRDLDGYNVYRSMDNVAYELIATVEHDPTVASFEYFDTDVDAGQSYYYQVTAIHNFGEVICESYPAFSLNEPENDYVYVLVTSIDDVNAIATRLYPNPANANITIEAPAMQRITVVNAIGQVVYDAEVNGDRQQLNTSSYEAGVYLVRITTADGIDTKRVTIVR